MYTIVGDQSRMVKESRVRLNIVTFRVQRQLDRPAQLVLVARAMVVKSLPVAMSNLLEQAKCFG